MLSTQSPPCGLGSRCLFGITYCFAHSKGNQPGLVRLQDSPQKPPAPTTLPQCRSVILGRTVSVSAREDKTACHLAAGPAVRKHSLPLRHLPSARRLKTCRCPEQTSSKPHLPSSHIQKRAGGQGLPWRRSRWCQLSWKYWWWHW